MKAPFLNGSIVWLGFLVPSGNIHIFRWKLGSFNMQITKTLSRIWSIILTLLDKPLIPSQQSKATIQLTRILCLTNHSIKRFRNNGIEMLEWYWYYTVLPVYHLKTKFDARNVFKAYIILDGFDRLLDRFMCFFFAEPVDENGFTKICTDIKARHKL